MSRIVNIIPGASQYLHGVVVWECCAKSFVKYSDADACSASDRNTSFKVVLFFIFNLLLPNSNGISKNYLVVIKKKSLLL